MEYYVKERRLAQVYYVSIEGADFISISILKQWVEPYFYVSQIDNKGTPIGTICFKDFIGEYQYFDGIFYINNKLSESKKLYNLMAIIRLLFKLVAINYGYFNVHASCVEINSEGILLCAERNNGKTTLLLEAMRDPDIDVIANDQVMLNSSDNSVLGYPAAIGVRLSSIKSFNKINGLTVITYVEDPYQKELKPIIHINEFKKIFPCNIKDRTTVKCVIKYQKMVDIGSPVNIVSSERIIDMTPFYLPIDKVYNNLLVIDCIKSIYRCSSIKINAELTNEKKMNCWVYQTKCGLDYINRFYHSIVEELHKPKKNEDI